MRLNCYLCYAALLHLCFASSIPILRFLPAGDYFAVTFGDKRRHCFGSLCAHMRQRVRANTHVEVSKWHLYTQQEVRRLTQGNVFGQSSAMIGCVKVGGLQRKLGICECTYMRTYVSAFVRSFDKWQLKRIWGNQLEKSVKLQKSHVLKGAARRRDGRKQQQLKILDNQDNNPAELTGQDQVKTVWHVVGYGESQKSPLIGSFKGRRRSVFVKKLWFTLTE